VFAALVVASVAAFAATQRLKHTPTVVQRFTHSPFFVPHSTGIHDQERLSFRIASADEVTVTIVNSSGAVVATLVHDRPLARYTPLRLRWSGRTGGATGYTVVEASRAIPALVPTLPGAVAPAGEYRMVVSLRGQRREVTSPWSFRLLAGSRAPTGARG